MGFRINPIVPELIECANNIPQDQLQHNTVSQDLCCLLLSQAIYHQYQSSKHYRAWLYDVWGSN